ncbi:hypothetical protein [Psychrobacillus lasiicapitis]|uniref:hypothetical protein n=1 Tax=Psychrobacillus lasiicapitis TaxID=1636719 RepID=UPI001990F5CF|nr:hypothetical protein [Psychrobacillus lasiicapitis]GGA44772.1 hypothetical protein GCM10011384_38110 [Psychrobacillus lasiicapitis]
MNQNRHSCSSCGQMPQWGNQCGCGQVSPWQQPAAQPIVCPPQYRVRDSFLPRMQPVIHPIVNVNREHIVNVPQHFWTETNRNVVVNPPQQAFPMQQGGFQQPFGQQFGQPMGQQFGQQMGQQQFFPGQPR